MHSHGRVRVKDRYNVSKKYIVAHHRKNMDCCGFARAYIINYSKQLSDGNGQYHFNNRLTVKQRVETFLHNFVHFTGMTQQNLENFFRQVDNVSSKNGYWKNSNKAGEKVTFIKTFSLETWSKLPLHEQEAHTLRQCKRCRQLKDFDMFKMKGAKGKSNVRETMTGVLMNTLNQLETSFEDKFCIPIEDGLLQLPVVKAEINQQKKNLLQELKENVRKSELDTILSTGQSFNSHDKQRKMKYMHYNETEKTATAKDKVGPISSYEFDREGFLAYIKRQEEGARVNWCHLARNVFPVKKVNSELLIQNGNQVLQKFAVASEIDINKFNKDLKLVGRDIPNRRRLSLKRTSDNMSFVPERPAKELKLELNERISTGEIDIGVEIMEKVISTNIVNCEGGISESNVVTKGRMLNINSIRKSELLRMQNEGVLRSKTDEEYENMTEEKVIEELELCGHHAYVNDQELTNKDILKNLTRQRHFLIWHDHSQILGHSHFLVMLKFLYTPTCFLTDTEFSAKYPSKRGLSVQDIVEKPCIFILARSPSTDLAQLEFSTCRIREMEHSMEPVEMEGIFYSDINRFFCGDTPARQVEAGQQRGGNFPCPCGHDAKSFENLQASFHQSQEDQNNIELRYKLVTAGRQEILKKLCQGNTTSLSNLSVTELRKELRERHLPEDTKKEDMIKVLEEELKGVKRPPFMLFDMPSTNNLYQTCLARNLHNYEIILCEPMHDLAGVIKLFFSVLPTTAENKQAKKELETFIASMTGSKTEIRARDYRTFLVRLCVYVKSLSHNDIPYNCQLILECLCEICQISYGASTIRTPKQILRLYNLTFKFGVLMRKCLPKDSKLFGIYFHNICVHFPETYRIISLRSINAEDQERAFGFIKRTSEQTSNRKPNNIITDAIIRNQMKHPSSTVAGKQKSDISLESKHTINENNSCFSYEEILANPRLFQEHFKRIADFVSVGRVWYR